MTDPTQIDPAASNDDSSLEGDRTCAAQSSSGDSRTIDFTERDSGKNPLSYTNTQIGPLPEHIDRPIPIPVVPGYTIEAELGRGGMGVVYMARQLPLNRPVALKMILAGGHASPSDRTRFVVEAEAAARLSHPGIVSVYAFGTTPEGHPFFAQEYLSGGSLSRKLNGAPQPWRDAAALVAEIADAVQHAHEQGVVHRDLKPGNVLLTTDGRPKVTDFGLAKTSESGVTATGAMMGTPSYMAPEQAQNARAAGPLSDVYAVGAILYEALTGRPPFRAADALATLRQVQEQDAVAVRRLVPAVPRDLETICHKCLEKSPAKRYPSAAAFASDLRRALAGESIVARPSSTVERTVKWAKRRPAMAGLVTVSVLALVGLLAMSWFFTGRLQQEVTATRDALEKVREQKQIAESETKRAEDQSVKLRSELAFSNFTLARASFEQNRCEAAQDQLRQIPEDHRGWEWRWLRQQLGGRLTIYCPSRAVSVVTHPDGRRIISGHVDGTIRVTDLIESRELKVFRGHTGSVRTMAMSADGRRIITGSSDQSVRVWDVETGREVAIVRFGIDYSKNTDQPGTGQLGWVSTVAIDHKGRRAAFTPFADHIQLWDLETNEIAPLPHSELETTEAMTFFPDGQRLAVVTQKDHQVGILDLSGGKPLIRMEIPLSASVTSVAVSPDGQQIATGSSDTSVRVWDVATRMERTGFRGHSGAINRVAFSPDGRMIASASMDRTIRVWNMNTGQALNLIRGHSGGISSVDFTRDGRGIVSCSDDRTIRCWDIESGQPMLALPIHNDWISSLALTPNGQFVVTGSGDQSIGITELATGKVVHTLNGHSGVVYSVAVSPDGRRIASASGDRTVRLWDTATGQERHVLKGHTSSVTCVAFHPKKPQVASTSTDGTTRVWNIETGEIVETLTVNSSAFDAIAFRPDGQQWATSSRDGSIRLWDSQSHGSAPQSFTNRLFSDIRALVFSPDGRLIAGAGADKSVHLLETRQREGFTPLEGHDAAVGSVAFTPDGRRLASASRDRTVRIWDVAARRELLVLRGLNSPVTALLFNADGSRLITAADDGVVRVWDVLPERQHRSIASDDQPIEITPAVAIRIDHAVFSPDGRWLAVIRNIGRSRIIDIHTDQERQVLDIRGMHVDAVAFSPDGRKFVAGGINGKVRLWDLEKSTQPVDLVGHKGAVQGVAFSADGSKVYSWSIEVNMQFVKMTKEYFSWDAVAGVRLPGAPPADAFVTGDTNRHGDVIAWIDRDRIQLIDTKLTPQELAHRQQVFRADPFFHDRQAAAAEKDQDWFAAIFHLDRWLAAQPNNPEAHRRRGLVALECGDWDRAMWHFVAVAAVEKK